MKFNGQFVASAYVDVEFEADSPEAAAKIMKEFAGGKRWHLDESKFKLTGEIEIDDDFDEYYNLEQTED